MLFLKINSKIILCFSIIIAIFVGFVSKVCAKTDENNYSETINLYLDNKDGSDLPKHFRTTSDLSMLDNSLNLTGLKELNISGSQQFSPLNFPQIIKSIDTSLHIVDVDLREECHGFINDLPVSWKNIKNNANKGLSIDEIVSLEHKYLSDVPLDVSIRFFNDDKNTIIPKTVSDESTFITKNSASYIRIPVTDREIPSPERIDYFVANILNAPQNSWIHFHCDQGIGRTTTFMIFYDMMKNYKTVSAGDIISRQINLVALTEANVEFLTKDKRLALYNNFYDYCVQHGPDFKTTYSSFIESFSSQSSEEYPYYPAQLIS